MPGGNRPFLWGVVLGFSCVFASATEIRFQQQFESTIPPDTMQSSISISLRNSDQSEIKRFFDKLLQQAKSKQTACKGGQYSISPRYDYRSSPSKFIDYEGRISFSCEFTDTAAFDRSLKVIRQNTDSKIHRITQGQIQWISSSNKVESAIGLLRLSALEYGKAQAAQLTSVMGRTCTFSSIDLNQNRSPVRPMMRAAAMTESDVVTEAPIQSGQDIRISATYQFDCP